MNVFWLVVSDTDKDDNDQLDAQFETNDHL